jgi:hypothetical protein
VIDFHYPILFIIIFQYYCTYYYSLTAHTIPFFFFFRLEPMKCKHTEYICYTTVIESYLCTVSFWTTNFTRVLHTTHYQNINNQVEYKILNNSNILLCLYSMLRLVDRWCVHVNVIMNLQSSTKWREFD